MAVEQEVKVVVRATETGFDRVAEQSQKLETALKRFGELSRKAFAAPNTNPLANFQRDVAKAEESLVGFRKAMQSIGESGSIFGADFAKAMRTSLTEAIGGGGLTEAFRVRGVQLGEAIASGIRSVLSIPSNIAPSQTASGGAGGYGGSGGGGGRGGGAASPSGSGAHVDTIGTIMTGSVIGHMIARGGENIFEQTGALAQTRAQLKAQGISDADIADVETLSRQLSDKYRATTVPRLLQQYGEYRTVFGDPNEAKAFMPIGAQVDLALKNLQSSEDWAKAIDPEQAQLDLAKAVELKGDALKPEKARADVEAILKAISAFKGQILPGDFLQAFKYARGSLRGFNDDFLFQVLPTLIAEFKSRGGQGGPAGVALQSFYRTVLKGNLGKAEGEWSKLGLLDKDGRPFDLDLARENPLQWWQKDVSPKLAGMTPAQKKDIIAQMFPTAIPEQMANIFENDSLRLAKDAGNIRAAADLDKLQADFKNAPTQAMSEFTAQWHNLLAALGDPLMPAAIGTLKGLAGAFSSLTGFMHDHPIAGLTGGAGALVGGGWLLSRALPFMLRNPLLRFGLGAAAGGLAGGSMEALLFGLLLGGGGEGGAGAGAATGPGRGLRMFQSLRGGAGVVGAGAVGAFARATSWVKNLTGVLRSTISLGLALEGLMELLNGGGPMFDVGKALWGDVTHAKDRKDRWWSLDDQFRSFVDDTLNLKGNSRWEAYKNRVFPDQKQKNIVDSMNAYQDRFPALAAWEANLGSGNTRGRPWKWQGIAAQPPPPTTFLSPGQPPPFKGFSRVGAASSGPIPVTVQSMPKGQDRPNVVTTNVTVNVQTNASGVEIAGAVGSAVSSAQLNRLNDIHH